MLDELGVLVKKRDYEMPRRQRRYEYESSSESDDDEEQDYPRPHMRIPGLISQGVANAADLTRRGVVGAARGPLDAADFTLEGARRLYDMLPQIRNRQQPQQLQQPPPQQLQQEQQQQQQLQLQQQQQQQVQNERKQTQLMKAQAQ